MNARQVPGFFGKIPARGDFLSRRLPAEIAAAWEAWLQDLTVAVRDSGQPGWQDAWLTAPLWHFTLGAALVPPYGAAGVLVASADRVGRLYPFTVIGAAAPGQGDGHWPAAAESLALAALDDAYDPATLDAALLALGPPPPQHGPNRPSGLWPVMLDGDWPAADDPFANGGPGPNQSEWWCRGSDRVAPVRLLCTGLPGRRTAEAMILGGEGVLVPDVLA